MKKDVPFTFKVPFHSDKNSLEEFLMFGFNRIIEEGYNFSERDLNLYLALLIRQNGVEGLSETVKNYVILNNSIRPEIQFQKTALAIQIGEVVPDEEMVIHSQERLKRASARKEIIMEEIQRIIPNPHNITFDNSPYYRELLNIIQDFDDVTLIDWFLPIVLKFERFVHIYVKHVEKTKFGESQSKKNKRTFFDYKHTEILTLIKKVVNQEEESIKNHFIDVFAGKMMNDNSKIKDYHRGFKNPILLGTDAFLLTIDKYGFINSFYQINTAPRSPKNLLHAY